MMFGARVTGDLMVMMDRGGAAGWRLPILSGAAV